MKSRKLYDALGRRLQVPRNRLQDFPATQWQINDLIDDIAAIESVTTDVTALDGRVTVLEEDLTTLTNQVDNAEITFVDIADAASASFVGRLRYRVSGNNSYTDMCMQTGASTYEWINIVQYNW